MRALIIGAGIGGLTTALYLHRLGIEVKIFESVQEIKPLGAGINLLPHGTKALTDLGLQERMDATAIHTREIKYLTKYGQEIYSDPRGLYAGFKWPQYSIHRGHLQMLILDAVIERLGADCLQLGRHLIGFEQSSGTVKAFLADKATGRPVASVSGDFMIAADGIHSVARRQFYPDEGPAIFSGVMMWRGVAETDMIMDGETMFIAGNFREKAVIYPMSRPHFEQGRSLTNWVMEIRVGGDEAPEVEDWNREGDISEFYDTYAEWDFGFLNVPKILKATPKILRYPMVDRNPLPRWTFGRVTLLGDAAHPMYPMGANGASQAILDAVALSEALTTHQTNIEAALETYQKARQGPTAEVVRSNRQYGPEAILQIVEERLTGPDDRIEDLITREEIDEITLGYRKVAGFDVDKLNQSDGS